MDAGVLRAALSRVPTGVAVVTTLNTAGQPVGLTANSITLVGEEPGVLVWSLGEKSRSRRAFEDAAVFGVSLLEAGQMDLARQMSGAVGDRFAGVDWIAGKCTQVPLISGTIARFECRKTDSFAVGDHLFFVGAIADWQGSGGQPLCFLAGHYVRPEQSSVVAEARGARRVSVGAG